MEGNASMTDYSQMPIDVLIRELGYALTAARYHLEAIERAARRNVLDVPYYSQWGLNANQRNGDCGPAALAGILEYAIGGSYTVDGVAAACGQPKSGPGSKYTTSRQLVTGAGHYGLQMNRVQIGMYSLVDYLAMERPLIALIDYGILRNETDPLPEWVIKNQDRGNFYHWVAVVGVIQESYSGSQVVINDSDFWHPRTDDGDHRVVPCGAFEAAWAAGNYLAVVME